MWSIRRGDKQIYQHNVSAIAARLAEGNFSLSGDGIVFNNWYNTLLGAWYWLGARSCHTPYPSNAINSSADFGVARARALQEFSLEKMCEATMSLYEAVLVVPRFSHRQ